MSYFSINSGTFISSQIFCKKFSSKKSKPGLTLIAINSKCFFGTPKRYEVDAFILDYMYDN